MPCKCLTGCINKKCSCRAKGISCTDECTHCSKKDKYECYNVPGKEPPKKTKSTKPKKVSRKSSKVSSDNSDSDYSDNETALVKSSKTKDTVKKNVKDEDKVIHQTVIINNYYNHTEYKQQNNTYTQVINHNYDKTDNQNINHLLKNISISDDDTTSSDSSKSDKLDKKASKNSNNTENNKNTLSNVPKLTESLANEFLKFYWECLSNKDKTKYLEKYVSTGAELKIQGIPFIGAKVITERLGEAAPMKVNKMEFNIFPISTPTPKKFSVSEINKKLLPAAKVLATASSNSNGPLSESEPKIESKNKALSNTDSVNKLLANYHRNSSSSSINENGESKSLVFTNPNLPSIGKIETKGEMMDSNGYTAEFDQIFYLVYNRISNVVQIKESELEWKT
ncbi:hypothetical protein BCR36DRAFT_401451 [Piromyces finnis]|uniref:NTF2 domain-containing protein n=1 Tax=Piromyces finnis TaxID=1754191 RepID=A0A1Y1VLN8_9FUNG|nr:hypothetical protein BCR36DRAFT_401451 [Piromyces finnis]|eukprot:ORX59844.1 hypothetical protein BCR36DRAFT_401451 [Piromyces finnis]